MSKQGGNIPTEGDDWSNKKPSRKTKKLRLEYRMKPRNNRRLSNCWRMFRNWEEWGDYHKKYKTEAARKTAMATMNRTQDVFEYRLPNGEK